MEDREISRRRFGVGAATVLGVSLAGCTDGGPGNGDDEDVGGNESGNGNENDNESGNGSENGNETGNDNDNESEDEEETNGDPTLSILLENEDGETVSSNVALEIDPQHRPITYQFSEDIEDGRIVQDGVEGLTVEGGEYVITVESLADEFEPVEETVTVDDEDEAVTITLEGATGDDEAGTGDGESEDADDVSDDGDENGDENDSDADDED